MRVVNGSGGQLYQALSAAFQGVAEQYDRRLRMVIETPRQWEAGFGVTERKNGETVVGSYRNIVDLGSLRDSQRYLVSGLKAVYLWDGDGKTPAVLVHDGYTTRSGKKIPARRWTVEAAQELRIPETFSLTFKRLRNA